MNWDAIRARQPQAIHVSSLVGDVCPIPNRFRGSRQATTSISSKLTYEVVGVAPDKIPKARIVEFGERILRR